MNKYVIQSFHSALFFLICFHLLWPLSCILSLNNKASAHLNRLKRRKSLYISQFIGFAKAEAAEVGLRTLRSFHLILMRLVCSYAVVIRRLFQYNNADLSLWWNFIILFLFCQYIVFKNKCPTPASRTKQRATRETT